MATTKLTPKQLAFVEHYVACGNATEAALKAGYSDRTARAIGAENLTKPNIAAHIEYASQKASSERILTAQARQERLSEIATSGSDSDAIRAIDTLNKMDAIYLQRVEMDSAVVVIADADSLAD